MSAISRELSEQLGDVGKAFEKLFPEHPAINTQQELDKINEENRKLQQARAESILAHVRELGDDY